MLRLVSIVKTPKYAKHGRRLKPGTSKKYVATFQCTRTGKRFSRTFGDAAYEDYTTHKDPHRRRRYITRHARGEKQHWRDPTTPAALSRFVLWEVADIRKAIARYRRRVARAPMHVARRHCSHVKKSI
jgi:hypothetical protein